MPYIPIDEETNIPIVDVLGDPPPDPHDPPGTLEGLVLWLADWVLSLRAAFWDMGDYVDGVPFVGDALAAPFNWVGDISDAIQRGVRSWSPTARDWDYKLGDILTWEGITDKISATFFDDKSPLDFFTDALTDFFDEHVKPTLDSLWDSATDLYNYIDNQIDNLEIADWDSLSGGAEEWLRDLLYKLLPWGDAPDLSMLEEASAWLGNSIDGIPWLADIKSWYDSVVSDAREFLDDPQGWLSRNMEGAFSGMLSLAGWPLLRAIEAFLNRMWDEKE